MASERPGKLLASCYADNSIRIEGNVMSYFPAHTYNGLEDLATTIMNPANCHSSKITLTTKETNYDTPERIYVYKDITKPNLVGDTCVHLLTTLQFPSNTGYHRFDYLLYRPVEQSFIESITITTWLQKMAMMSCFKTGQFLVSSHYTLKRKHSRNNSHYIIYNGSIYTILCKSKWWLLGCGICLPS
jgi:hypothetical protein